MRHATSSTLSIAVFAALSALTLTLTLTTPSFATDANILSGKSAPGTAPRVVQPPAQPLAQPPAQPVVGLTPATTLMPTKITLVKVSVASIMAGSPLKVSVYGAGQQKYCGTSIVIDQLTPEVKNNYGDMSSKYQYETAGWPRVATFTITEVGTYQVRLLINVANQNAIHCGYGGEGSIAGDLTKFEVSPTTAK